ncbi:hypothetical protein TW79_08860 [Tritonibacter mobilis]|uniref:Uncharacterized protein n=1 Tax=Tritonibacter mobilis F1926 TaxID=1265309 RepID=A0A1B1AA12_9RHOB|nr:hypothetical protein K529_021820 [Tritonibacter mobilis F1926]KJZ24664.1 hypothetical protein TW79_08860 [Tritonibacter mobilis]
MKYAQRDRKFFTYLSLMCITFDQTVKKKANNADDRHSARTGGGLRWLGDQTEGMITRIDTSEK